MRVRACLSAGAVAITLQSIAFATEMPAPSEPSGLPKTGERVEPWPSTIGECDRRERTAPDFDSALCYWRVSRRSVANKAAAARRLDAMLSIQPEDARLLVARALLAGDLDDYEAAEAGLRSGAERFAAAGDRRGEAFAWTWLGLLHGLLSREVECEDALSKARSLVEALDDSVARGRLLLAEGLIANKTYDYAKAMNSYKRAAEALPPGSPVYPRSIALHGVGTILGTTSRFREAIDSMERSAALLAAAGDRHGEADVRADIAHNTAMLHFTGEVPMEEYHRLVDRALELATVSGNRGAEAFLRGNLVFDFRRPLVERREHARRALEIRREQGLLGEVSLAFVNLAIVHFGDEREDRDKAFRFIEQAIETARSAGDFQRLAIAHHVRALNLWRLGEQERAVEDLRVGAQAIERIRDLQRDDFVRARSFAEWHGFFYVMVGVLLEPWNEAPPREAIDRALEAAERFRARNLLDTLDAVRASGPSDPDDPAWRRRAEVLDRISGVQKRLLTGRLGRADRRTLLEELDRLETDERELRSRVSARDERFARLRTPHIPTLDEIQSGLASDQALLVYSISSWGRRETRQMFGGGSWCFVIARDTARVFELSDIRVLNRTVPVYLGLLERRDGLEADASARLYEDLMARPLASLPGDIRRLVIVPDRVLHTLPFGVLRATPDGEPLARRYDISLSPSATLWLRLRSGAPAAAPPKVLAYADPDISHSRGAAAFRESTPWLEGFPLGRLPHAREEARTFLATLGGSGRLLSGVEASERSLKAERLHEYDIVHFAAHALVDYKKPERSAVLLTPGDDAEDGLLQIREVVDLDLDDKIVILTACRSAAGEIVAGEGSLGLSRAFFQAGARAVVASLWPLRDDETADLIAAFSRQLANGVSLGTALAAARRDLMDAGAPAAAWAGIVLIGDADFTPVPGGLPPRRTVAGFGATAVFLLAIVLGVILASLWRTPLGN